MTANLPVAADLSLRFADAAAHFSPGLIGPRYSRWYGWPLRRVQAR